VAKKSKRAEAAFDELFDGYQALADIITELPGSEVSYEMGYLDGWWDAMSHWDWAYEGKPLKAKKAFGLFRARSARSLARDGLKKRRAERL
jgi:hypothetical protein